MIRWCAAALCVLALPLSAETRLVSNPEMCAFEDPFETLEMGLTLTETDLSEIEFYCQFGQPLDINWAMDRHIPVLAACSEPGELYAATFILQLTAYEPELVRLFWSDRPDPTELWLCR